MNVGTSLLNAASGSAALLKQKSPLILTSASIGLGVTSTIMAVKATPEAMDIYKQIMNSDLPDDEKRRQVILYVVPLYSTAALTGITSAACGIASYKIQQARLDKAYEALAGVSTAYILAQGRLKKYQDEILERFGEHVEEEIEDKVIGEQAKESSKDSEKRKYFIANAGPEIEMEDSITGQHFMSTKDEIFFYFADLWTRLEYEEQIAASDYLYAVDCKQCSKADDVGWICGSRPWPKFIKTPYSNDEDGYYYVVMVDTDPGFKPICNY